MQRLHLRCYTKFWQRIKSLSLIGGLIIGFNQAYALSPALIDLRVNDSKMLELTTGVDYLLVLHNENPHGTNFYFGEFAQSVFTHYLQGSASVSHDSIAVPSYSKVQWLFSPAKAGEYAYYAVDGSNDQKGEKGKIIVKQAESTIETDQNPKPAQMGLTVTALEESKPVEPQTEPKRRWLKGGRRD